MSWPAFCIAALAVSAAAQKTPAKNNNRTTNTLPVDTGSRTLGSSPIAVAERNGKDTPCK